MNLRLTESEQVFLEFFSRVHNKFFRTRLLVKKVAKIIVEQMEYGSYSLETKKRAEFVRLKMSKMRT